MYRCPCDICAGKVGGSSTTEETCKQCGQQWTRYRSGSWDVEYQDCMDCIIIEVIKENKNLLIKLEENGDDSTKEDV